MIVENKEAKKTIDINRNRNVIKKLFVINYFIVRKRWAQVNFGDFVKFVADLGVADLAEHLEVSPPFATYLSGTTVTELINITGDYIEKSLLSSLRSASYYSLLADESTDERGREQLSIYAKWFHNNTIDDHFLGIVHVKRTDAASLMAAIEEFLVEVEVDVTKCKFIAFDGTNTMSGEVSGKSRYHNRFCVACKAG